MIFSYKCTKGCPPVERFVWDVQRDYAQKCDCGADLRRVPDATGGLQRHGVKGGPRNDSRSPEQSEDTSESARLPTSPFYLTAKDSVFAGNFNINGYEAAFVGDFDNCAFSGEINHNP